MVWKIIGDIVFDILTYGIFLYSTFLFLSYLFIAWFSIVETKRYMHKNSFTDYRVLASSVHAPSVSIIAPAYNEGNTIVENVKSLLSIFYVNLEVIVVNDGSKDDCLQKLIDAYQLEKVEYFVDYKILTKEVRGIYKSRNSVYHKLLVIDKVNGGKADALNVGINVSSNNYLVCIDVDCILEQDALLRMVKPFLEQTEDERVIASGGVIRIANSCVIEDGKLVKVKLTNEYLPRMQILEYIRAFILGRMAWSRLNGLMLISGAFGAFDKEIAIKCGGYNHNTVGEDMELVVRMRRYMEERQQKYRVTYIPDPLCWTEAPASLKILGRQRNRWTRGTIETLKLHKVMLFNPRYRLLGMLSYPYWFFFEMCAPGIEFFGFVFFLVFASVGLLDWAFFFSYLFFIISFGYLYSVFAILMEVRTFNQYNRRTDILKLLLTAFTEPFYFHPFVVWSGVKGYIDYLRKKTSWGEMTRQGFAKKTETPVIPVPETIPVLPETDINEVLKSALVASITPELPEALPPQGKPSLISRVIVPALKKIPGIILRASKVYVGYAAVLLLLIVAARAFELIYDKMQHGTAPFLGKAILYGLAKDGAFFMQAGFYGFLVFTGCYLLHRKLAGIVFAALTTLFLLIQVSLSQYFVTALVPLGADLWSYSMADIKQTVGAAGGIRTSAILGFLLLLALSVTAFLYLPKRIKIHGFFAFLLFLLFITSRLINLSGLTDKLLPGQEYSNNLSVNKFAFFFASSYDHFFPPPAGQDIYSDTYSGDFATDGAGKEKETLAKINYADEQHYPFLRSIDSTTDVLSPFFNTTTKPPNIVILLVEGLGRAFTNKGAYLGNFTPFLDSLSGKSLYWENFLSEGGRTFAVLPSVLGSLPFAKNGFNELGSSMPQHLSLVNVLKHNGYHTSFYCGGDSRFDNMGMYLEKNNINGIFDEKTFPSGYAKMPASASGFSWGYGDKELFRRYLQLNPGLQKPYLNVVLTVSTHNPFLINNQDYYLKRFEQRMTELNLDEATKSAYRGFKNQYASILFTNDALRELITAFSKLPDYNNTVFLITGDHRIPEIPMSTKIDRYHVPLIIYSPLLKRTAHFASISTHFDITPSLLAWLKKSHQLQVPAYTSWMGTGLDTARQFRNIHAYPFMQTKSEVSDFVMGTYMLNGNTLYSIDSKMGLKQEPDPAKAAQVKAALDVYKARNDRFLKTLKLVPDSLLQRFAN